MSPLPSTGLALLAVALVGCSVAPAPERVNVPRDLEEGRVKSHDALRPLPEPEPGADLPPPPFDDVTLVEQEPPEQAAFLASYRRAGEPQLAVFVNRATLGAPVGGDPPVTSRVERTRRVEGGRADVERRSTAESVDGDLRETTERLDAEAGTTVTDVRETYGERRDVDELGGARVDYDLFETTLESFLAAGGQTKLVSSASVRANLTGDAAQGLAEGRLDALKGVADRTGTDVLVLVTVRPTRQAAGTFRVAAEAMRVADGASLARATTDVPGGLGKIGVNNHARFLARVLMRDMGRTLDRDAASQNAPRATGPDNR